MSEEKQLPDGFAYATSAELFEALGAPPDLALARQSAIEKLAGNKLKLVPKCPPEPAQ